MRLTNKCPTRSLAILRFALPAQVVKLVDTLASGASARKGVEVQVLSWAPPRILVILIIQLVVALQQMSLPKPLPKFPAPRAFFLSLFVSGLFVREGFHYLK